MRYLLPVPLGSGKHGEFVKNAGVKNAGVDEEINRWYLH
jgi:hypothetical protein